MKTISIYRWSYLAKSKAPLLGKVLLTTNHLPDLHITTWNNQNNNKPSIVLVWTLWSSGFLKFSEWLTKSQWYHQMSTLTSSYNVQKQHNLALENVRKNSTHLSKSSSSVEPYSVWKGTEWPIIAQNLRSICFQAFLGAFLPQVQGVRWILMLRGFRICMTKAAGSQKRLVMGNFQSVPCYRKGTDQKPPITRHFLLPTPLCHTHSEPSGHEYSSGPLNLGQKCTQKCMETNTFQVLGNCGSFSPPPPYFRIISSKVFDHACCWDTLLKTLDQSRQEINSKCKCKQTSNEYRQTPPNTQCCLLLEICPLLYILFPTKY